MYLSEFINRKVEGKESWMDMERKWEPSVNTLWDMARNNARWTQFVNSKYLFIMCTTIHEQSGFMEWYAAVVDCSHAVIVLVCNTIYRLVNG